MMVVMRTMSARKEEKVRHFFVRTRRKFFRLAWLNEYRSDRLHKRRNS